jgi:hypothetical protein
MICEACLNRRLCQRALRTGKFTAFENWVVEWTQPQIGVFTLRDPMLTNGSNHNAQSLFFLSFRWSVGHGGLRVECHEDTCALRLGNPVLTAILDDAGTVPQRNGLACALLQGRVDDLDHQLDRESGHVDERLWAHPSVLEASKCQRPLLGSLRFVASIVARGVTRSMDA